MSKNEPNANETADEPARSSDESSESSDGVLSPEDLAIEADEHVRSIGDDRFLVSTGGGSSSRPPRGRPAEPRSDGGQVVTDRSPSPTEALAESDAGFGVDMAVKTGDGVSRRRVTSNDIREVFTEMLRWYAVCLDESADPAETLSYLRVASELDF
jgi:hypothetical protein